MKAEKIVLAVNEESAEALYLFKTEHRTQFVVGMYDNPAPKIGTKADGWYNGHYFNLDLDAALKYLRRWGVKL